MKHSMKKTLLALVCAVGLTATPQTHCVPAITKGGVAKLLILWEVASLIDMAYKGSKSDFQQRAFLDMSPALLKNNPKQWTKNAAKNLVIAQRDYVEGQAYKGSSLKLNHEKKLEQSKKCLPHGLNGNLLGLIASINKASKNVKEIALLVFTLKAAQSSRLMKHMGWENPDDKKKATDERQANKDELIKLNLEKARRENDADRAKAQADDNGAGGTPPYATADGSE